MEPFVVHFNRGAVDEYRRFWTGPLGSAVLIVPAVSVIVLGVVLGIGWADSGATWFFAGVVVFSGLYAAYAGWDHRRKAAQEADADPWAFVVAVDGVMFPRHKHYSWTEARFVVTAEARPRLLCTPVGHAYPIDSLDRGPDEIHAALHRASAGVAGLERAAR